MAEQEDIRIARNAAYKKIKEKFDDSGLFIPQVGRDKVWPDLLIGADDGTWQERTLHSKTPGYIIQLKVTEDGSLEAGQFVPNGTTGKLGYINIANVRNVAGGISVRVFPVIVNPENKFEKIAKWEWNLILVFSQILTGGSSADTINKFFPPAKTVEWKGIGGVKQIEITNAALLGLVAPDDVYTYAADTPHEKQFRYSEATEAIIRFFTIDF